jgi:hypothetical protein
MADMTKPVTDMTMADLKAFILEVIYEDERSWGKKQGIRGEGIRELIEAMRQNMIVSPPGAKTSLELLREDRDR